MYEINIENWFKLQDMKEKWSQDLKWIYLED